MDLRPRTPMTTRTTPTVALSKPVAPRLAAIDPEAIARHVVAVLRGRLESMARPLSPAFRLAFVPAFDGAPPLDDLETHLAQTVLRLANYAVTGAVGDWEDVGEAVDEGIDLASRASGWTARGLTVVIDAARGRAALAAGEPVAARGLAALAGVEASHTRQFARSGEPSAAPTPAKEARRWLGPRNVVGV
jgi:hypothetical protein